MPQAHPEAGIVPNPLFDSIDLVTFDTFGTLVDWRQALPGIGLDIDRMPAFLEKSERRQRPDRRDSPFVPYRSLLQEVAMELRPELPADEASRWARRFGELPFFGDVPAGIALLAAVVDVGVVSNCDAVHQLDVSRRLGRPWDVAVVAEELGAYKPTDRAWDRAVAMVEERGYDRARWLHVSAWDDYDLGPAAARGLRTCFVPRPGGLAPRAGAVDMAFDDVLHLARTVAATRGGPIAHVTDAHATSSEVARRYARWMEEEHLAEVRGLAGVRRAELVSMSDVLIRSIYRFTGRASFQRYLDRHAPRAQSRIAELFQSGELRLETQHGVVLHAL